MKDDAEIVDEINIIVNKSQYRIFSNSIIRIKTK